MSMSTKTYWFVSRHEPTDDQHRLVNGNLVKVDDINAFDKNAVNELVRKASEENVDGFIVVNPALALNIAAAAFERKEFTVIGVFENANRAPEGQKPTFEAKALHWWSVEYGADSWFLSAW